MLEAQETNIADSTGTHCEVITLGGATCHWRHTGIIPNYHVIATDQPLVFLHDTI
jgi:hypothetical protein